MKASRPGGQPPRGRERASVGTRTGTSTTANLRAGGEDHPETEKPLARVGQPPRGRRGRLPHPVEPPQSRKTSAWAERTLRDLRCWEGFAVSFIKERGLFGPGLTLRGQRLVVVSPRVGWSWRVVVGVR
ncbi:hypothetical protein GCM10010519_42390 [Streptomyces lactacystinicus]